MTELERCMNYLRFGTGGDYIETDDGRIRITRIDDFVNTIPHCYITEDGETRVASFDEVVEVLRRMI